MPTITRVLLSGSTNGQAIAVSATAGDSNLLHTFSSATTTVDEVFLFAAGQGSNVTTLTIELGASASKDQLKHQVPQAGGGAILVVPGISLRGAATPPTLNALVTSTDTVSVWGHINRYVD